MVIECTECHTRFRLADEKVKPEGTKVRCSKCKHIFTVMPPESHPSIPAASPPPPPPGPSSPEDSAGTESGEFSPSPDRSWAAQESNRGEDSRDETGTGEQADSDRSFNFDTPESAGKDEDHDEQASASDSFSFDFSFEGEEAEGGLAPPSDDQGSDENFSWRDEEETGSEPPSETGDEEEQSIAGDFDFGDTETDISPGAFSLDEKETPSAGDFSFDDTEPAGGERFFFDPPAESSGDAKDTDGGRDAFDFDFAGPSASAAIETAKETDSEEDFDFSRMTFGESSSSLEVSDTVRPSIPPDPPKEPSRPPQGLKTDSPPPPPIREVMAAEPQAARRKSPYSRLLVLLLVLLLSLSGTAGYFMYTGQPLDFSSLLARVTGQQPVASPVIEQIRLSGLSGAFIDNVEAGQLFVIQGTATNGFPESRSAIAVKGILFGEKGEPLLQQTVFCGNALDEAALRTLPFAKIEESMNNQFGDSLSNLNVAPGKVIPFTIVFKNLPAGLAEFTVEVADSRPGSK